MFVNYVVQYVVEYDVGGDYGQCVQVDDCCYYVDMYIYESQVDVYCYCVDVGGEIGQCQFLEVVVL